MNLTAQSQHFKKIVCFLKIYNCIPANACLFLVQHDEENKPKRSALHRPDGHPGRGEQHQRRGDLGQRLEGG